MSAILCGVDALRVHLQPIVELRSSQVWGVEALARFPGHPQPGPDKWFAAAERLGLGPVLEAAALRGALTVLDRLPAEMTLSVNLSPTALLDPAVQELLTWTSSGQVVVEITEHEPVHDYPALIGALDLLRAEGVRVAIDDFGAGHSSLRHVLQVRPDVVKLDLTIVQGVDEDPARQAVVEAMLIFCERLGVRLVAEGVEEPGDLERLLEMGVHYGQGWFLARPAEPDLVLSLLGTKPEPLAVFADDLSLD
ncbi:MAG TPA: EAL domain-containing protein [Mycobacteriales bacterium]|nr:EAL domain-containing protein [Mycobacteriales bacterium]